MTKFISDTVVFLFFFSAFLKELCSSYMWWFPLWNLMLFQNILDSVVFIIWSEFSSNLGIFYCVFSCLFPHLFCLPLSCANKQSGKGVVSNKCFQWAGRETVWKWKQALPLGRDSGIKRCSEWARKDFIRRPDMHPCGRIQGKPLFLSPG